MATSFFKSLQCKSTALDDVVCVPKPKKALIPAASCGGSTQTLRDVVFLFPKHPPLPKKPPEDEPIHHPPQSGPKLKPKSRPKSSSTPSQPPAAGPTSPFSALTDLPSAHSSRRVVEIIFGSSWSPGGSQFPGRIEMLFRVHNPARTVARFEEYRSLVRARAGASDARCAADGNEMMRFHCSSSGGGGGGGGGRIYDASVNVSESGGVRTFAGSGGAHESGGGGAGRRAMLVCRVIVGRVRGGSDPESSGESVCGAGKGELVVLDPRAVLPCFLIIPPPPPLFCILVP